MLIPLQLDPTALASGVNTVWVLTVSFLIFFMQPGFALLEAGQVRSKNVANVLMKNMMDWGVGVLVYFLVGAGIATVAVGITSSGSFSIASAFAYVNDPSGWVGWLFGAVFAMTAATIVSGAVAERIKFEAYVLIIVVFTAVIYPVTQGITWSGGLLAGLVAVTGAVPHVTWWGGLALGIIAGIQTPIVYRWVVDALKIDDVCGVFAVHGSAGAIGTFLIPVFAVDGFSATQLLMQGVGVVVIAAWGIVATYVVFKIADATVGLRVTEAEEMEGLDISEHNSTAYPEFVGSEGGTGPSGTPAVTDGGEVN